MRKEVTWLYHSAAWQEVRQGIILRAHGLCELCGQPGTEVHHKIHVTAANVYDPSITLNPDNLILLCRDCHFDQHRGEHAGGRKHEEDYDYTFDENGQLIPKTQAAPGV